MELCDTHCHLPALELPLEELFANATAGSVTRIICIGASEGIITAPQAVELATNHSNVWATVGIHPHDAKNFTELSAVAELANHPRVVAIGETGLDYFRDLSPKDRQLELFRNSIHLAKRVKKPLVIHCRDAEQDTVRILREERAEEVGGVFHCYSGDEEMAKELSSIGFLVSFTGTITFKKADRIREIVRAIPLEQIMVETDAPYMAPEPFRGGPSEPMHVYQIALKIAEVKGISLEQVAEQTTANAIRLFGLQ